MRGQVYDIELLKKQNCIPMQSQERRQQQQQQRQQQQQQQNQQQACTTSSTSVPISPVLVAPPRRLPSRYHSQRHLVRNNNLMATPSPTAAITSKLASRRQHLQQYTHLQHQQQCNHKHHRHPQQHQRHLQRPRVIRASEYKNLRQVVPSLRRQRDVGKVEVVTEAARYIDHLHKTLIERFVLCGIPNSLKDILGTDNANELNSQHIMNLVTSMAGKQRQQVLTASSRPELVSDSVNASRNAPKRARGGISRNIASSKRALYVPNHQHSQQQQQQQQTSTADLIIPQQQINSNTLTTTTAANFNTSNGSKGGLVTNSVSGCFFRRTLPVVLVKPRDLVEENENEIRGEKSTQK